MLALKPCKVLSAICVETPHSYITIYVKRETRFTLCTLHRAFSIHSIFNLYSSDVSVCLVLTIPLQRCALVPSCGAVGTAIPAPSMIWITITITAATVSTDMAYCGR